MPSKADVRWRPSIRSWLLSFAFCLLTFALNSASQFATPRGKVTFGDGTTQTIEVGRRLAPGSNSAGVALTGGPRCVKQIQVVGKGEGAATTRVWGDPHVDE